MNLKCVFDYPVINGSAVDMLDSGPIHEVAARAERAGFAGFALTDHPVPGARWLEAGGHQSLEPFVALGAAAAATNRIRLLTHLAVAPYRNPLLLAKAAASVDRVSGGRHILGIGAGYHKTEFFALGVDPAERNELFEEALEVLPLHWSGEPFSYRGRHFEARDVIARPRPVQRPIPIWIGGNSRLSRRRVAERAQGWMPMLVSAEVAATARTPVISSVAELAGMVTEVRVLAAEAGRTDTIDVLASYGGASLVSSGREVERHRQALAELEEAGATWVVISCHSRSASETFDFLDAFGELYLS